MEPHDFAGISLIKFAVAALTVIGLIGLFAWALKAFAARGWIAPRTGPARRLRIVDSLALDARRRLVIIRCDDVEHLLLLGAEETVIKTDLPSPSGKGLAVDT